MISVIVRESGSNSHNSQKSARLETEQALMNGVRMVAAGEALQSDQ